jgi:ribosomal protein S18 acetylase RimI-like enzyme
VGVLKRYERGADGTWHDGMLMEWVSTNESIRAAAAVTATTPEPTLRRATKSDRESLLAMMKAFNALEGIEWVPEAVRPALDVLLADEKLGFVGIVETDGMSGYVVLTWGFDLEWHGRDAFLTELYLEPESRGRGVGRGVLAAIERVARENGAGAMHLMVRPANVSAVRLYRGAGYSSPPRVFLSKVIGRG